MLDVGDRDYLALALRARPTGPLPTIVAAGPPITSIGGHCHYLGGVATGEAGIRAALREHTERGVDVIKVMASGGELAPGAVVHERQWSPDELRAAVDEAHRHGLPVTAHAHAVEAIADALAAGVDGIEHARSAAPTGSTPARACSRRSSRSASRWGPRSVWCRSREWRHRRRYCGHCR